MNDKIYTRIGNSPELSELIQKTAFENGFFWERGENIMREILEYKDDSAIAHYGKGQLQWSPSTFFQIRSYKEIPIPEFLTAIKGGNKKNVSVSLNGSKYVATISESGVTYGCQTFPHEKILELAEKIKDFGSAA